MLVVRSIMGFRHTLLVAAAVMVLAASCTSSNMGDAAVTATSTAASTSTTPTASSSTTASAAPNTTLSTTSTTSLAPIDRLDSDLSCRELAALGYSYVDAIRYWEREGVPDRMDADWDGIPCETAWPHDDVATFWGEPLPGQLVLGSPPTPSCVNGWVTPAPGREQRERALNRIREDLDLGAGDHVVLLELRYFLGPRDVDNQSAVDIDRWYIEARSRQNPTNAIRWIGQSNLQGHNVCLTAPPGTSGFEAGTWRASACGGKDPFEILPACLPENGPFCQCSWGVSGCSCADGENGQLMCTGPPPEVMGCLAGL